MAILQKFSPAQWNKMQLYGNRGIYSGRGGVATGAGGGGTPAMTMPTTVSAPFEQALAALTGAGSDVEKVYQQGKRRTLADIAMQSVQSGMANTLNLPAAGMAYEQAVRPGTNVAVAGQKAGILTNLGQTAANVYGTQVGAETAAQQMGLAASTDRARMDLQRYLADIDAQLKGKALSFEREKFQQSKILSAPQA